MSHTPRNPALCLSRPRTLLWSVLVVPLLIGPGAPCCQSRQEKEISRQQSEVHAVESATSAWQDLGLPPEKAPPQTERRADDDGVASYNQPSAVADSIVRDSSSADKAVRDLFDRAVELLKSNRAYQAKELLERAAELAPDSAGIWCNLGLAYQSYGNIPKAISAFDTALNIKPRMPEATLNMAGCYQIKGDNQEAVAWYSRYLQENKNAPMHEKVQDIISGLKASAAGSSGDAGKPDYYSSVTSHGVFRWSRDRLPLKVYIEPGEGVEGYRHSFKAALVDAFSKWAAASQRRIKFQFESRKDDAHIYCSWTADPALVACTGTQGERGETRIIARKGAISRATIKLLTQPILEESLLSDDDMKKACLHEIGHVLGMQGHSSNNHDVMFSTVDTATVWPVLTKRDIATLLKLYEGYPQLK